MTKRDDNREKFPRTAALIDDLRKAFPNIRVIATEEGGKTVGTFSESLDYQSTDYAKAVRERRGKA